MRLAFTELRDHNFSPGVDQLEIPGAESAAAVHGRPFPTTIASSITAFRECRKSK